MAVIHVMLDLETWGTEPGCDIRSIGACVFDPQRGWTPGNSAPLAQLFDGRIVEPCFYLATDNPRGYWGNGSARDRFFTTGKPTDRMRYSLTRDPKTVRWWTEQSAEAQAAFENPVDLWDATLLFTEWLDNVTAGDPTGLRLWCHGPAFDIPILAAAYEAVGRSAPWHYRAPRDTRTAFDMAGIVDHSAWLTKHPGPLGVPHHALDDAICQARALCGAWARVESPPTIDPERL